MAVRHASCLKVVTINGSESIRRSDGWSFRVPPGYEGRIHEGDLLEIDQTVEGVPRAVSVNGEQIWKLSDEQLRDLYKDWFEHKRQQQEDQKRQNEETWLAEIEALPPLLRTRMKRFISEDPTFLARNEGYDLFCCKEAVKIAGLVTEMLEGDTKKDSILSALHSFAKNAPNVMGQLVSRRHNADTFNAALWLAQELLLGNEV